MNKESPPPSVLAASSIYSAQPLLGVLGSIFVISLSLGFAVMLPPPVVIGWAGLMLTASVPALMVKTTVWRGLPATNGLQPLQGLVDLLVIAIFGAAISLAAALYFGGSRPRPTPFVIMPLVSAVPVTIWQVFLFDCWPFCRLRNSPVSTGLLTLVASYGIVTILVRFFFDEGFLRGSAFYDARLDPSGIFDARDVVAVLVGSAGYALAMMALDFWPVGLLVRRLPIVDAQPWRGALGMTLALGAAIISWAVCVDWLGQKVSSFQARICVSFIFGMFVLLVMLQGSLFARQPQPLRGLLIISLAGVVAIAAYAVYARAGALCGVSQTGDELDIWISTVMLAITFPAMAVVADLFEFWPFTRSK